MKGKVSSREHVTRSHMVWVQSLASFLSRVTLHMLPKLSVVPFSHLYNGDNNNVLWRLTRFLFLKLLDRIYLAQVNVC